MLKYDKIVKLIGNINTINYFEMFEFCCCLKKCKYEFRH